MKRWMTIFAALIMAISVLSYTIPAFAEGNAATSEVVINSFQSKDPLIVNKTIHMVVHVQRDDPKNPAKTVKNEDKALVYAFFTKGKVARQTQLTITKDGKYEGKIKLPKTGEWKVNVMAMLPDPTLGPNGTDKISTTWNVKGQKEQKQQPPVWIWILSGVGAVLVILLIIFMVRASNRRKTKLEAEKKERLKQQKNKKKKKKR